MKQYALTALAEEDLRELGDYIARDNAEVAAQVLGRIRDAMRLLAEQPLLGRIRLEMAGPIPPVASRFVSDCL